MIEIQNTEVFGLERAMRRSGFPLRYGAPDYVLNTGRNDLKRSIKLGNTDAGSGHDNFLKGILVQFDMKYSLYFTKQIQRYGFIDFISSQSTMHTITKRDSIKDDVNKYVNPVIINIIDGYTREYDQTENKEEKYELFMKIISNLPSGFEMWAGMTTNYLQLKTIYNQRKNHKLKEDWGEFCSWIERLPKFKELVLNK